MITPFFLGAVAGGIASGRVRAGLAQGGVITSWVNPTSLSCGVLAIGVCAYLSAVYLTAEARRGGQSEIAEYFRRCSLFSGAVVGAIALATLAVAHTDAGRSFGALTHRGLVLTLVSFVAGLVSLGLLVIRRYVLVRVTAAIAAAAVLWAWGYGRYPRLIPGLTLEQASAPHTTLQAVAISSFVGLAVLLPSLALLFTLFERPRSLIEGASEAASAIIGP